MRPVIFLVFGLLIFTALLLARGSFLPGSVDSETATAEAFSEVAEALEIQTAVKPVKVEDEGEYDFFGTVGNLARQIAGAAIPEGGFDEEPSASGERSGGAGSEGEGEELAAADPATVIPKPRPDPADEAPSRLNQKVKLTDSNIHENLQLFVGEVQKQLPMQIDSATTLEKVIASDLSVTYYYTLAVASDRIDKKAFKEKLRSQITSKLCKEKRLRELGRFRRDLHLRLLRQGAAADLPLPDRPDEVQRLSAPSGPLQRQLAQRLERHDVERAPMRRRQAHARRLPRLIGFQKPRRAQAPLIAGFQPHEAEFGPRRGQSHCPAPSRTTETRPSSPRRPCAIRDPWHWCRNSHCGRTRSSGRASTAPARRRAHSRMHQFRSRAFVPLA